MKNGVRIVSCLMPAVLLLSVLLSGCTTQKPQPDPIERSGFYFNTFINIRLYDSEDETILDRCMEAAERYENLFSATVEGSDIWRINHANGAAVTVEEETIDLIEAALSYEAYSGGVFDPSIGAVSTLWNFSEDPFGPVPEADAIAKALIHIDASAILVNGNTVQLTDPEAALDLGAIAKGFIADRFKELLTDSGVKSAIINLGGNVLTVGDKPDGSGFKIGVQKPFDPRNSTVTVIRVTDRSMVSSGNYERYFIQGDRLYHHILDPKTGYPAQNGLLGVTILSDTSLEGDALSTTCFLLGLEDGMQLIEATPGVEALFITGDHTDPDSYELHYSEGFPRE